MTHNNPVFTSLIVNVYILYLSFHNILSYTYPTAGVTAPVWHGGRALALPAPVFRAVGTRTGLPPVGIGPRAWTAVPAVWVPSRTRSKNEEVVNSTQEKMATFRIISVCICVFVLGRVGAKLTWILTETVIWTLSVWRPGMGSESETCSPTWPELDSHDPI